MDFTTAQGQQLLKEFQATSIQKFKSDLSVDTLILKLTHFTDALLLRTWAKFQLNQAKNICLIAVGGYGRSELFLYSDIDLLILTADNIDNNTLTQIEKFIRFLWDIGLEIGHRLHSYSACIEATKKDVELISNLIDSRFLAGDNELYHDLLIATNPKHMWNIDQFFKEKSLEQLARYRKYGESAYNLEPNIKNNPGGLRDIQMIHWLVKRYFQKKLTISLLKDSFLTADEYRELLLSQAYLWRTRFALHLFAGKREDRLLFNYQPEIAKLLAYQDDERTLAIEKFMHDYYRSTNTLRELNEMVIELFREEIAAKVDANIIEINERFQLYDDYLEVKNDQVFKQNPSALLEVFLILAKNPNIKGVRATTIRLIRQSKDLVDKSFRNVQNHNALFIKLLQQKTNVVPQLRRMKRYGILGQYIPEFGRIIGRMQYDLYHHYSVDAHTLFVIDNLTRFTNKKNSEQFPLAVKIIEIIDKIEVLYIAALFHDIAKGQGGDHSKLGAVMANNFCHNHNLNKDDTELIVWLVENHLIMSHTGQRKDIHDPNTIKSFAKQVKSKKYLDHLYLLTVADICATNPNLWNSWRASLLIQLYHSTAKFFATKMISQSEIVNNKKHQVIQILKQQSIPIEKVLTLWGNFKDSYFLFESDKNIAAHTKAIFSNRTDKNPCIFVAPHHDKGGTEIFIYMPAYENRFTITTTILANNHLNILEAGIFTTKDNYSLDIYIVLDQHNKPIDNQVSLQQTIETLYTALKNNHIIPKLNPRRITREKKHFNIKTKVSFQQDKQRNRTILMITSPDRPGFLAKISKVFSNCNLRLHNAKISTGSERVEDVFFITDQNNQPIIDEKQQQKIRTAIRTNVDT